MLLEQLDRADRELHRIAADRAKLAARLAERDKASTDAVSAAKAAHAELEKNRTEERAVNRRLEDLRNSRGAALKVLESGIGNAEAAERQLAKCDGLIDEAETSVLEALERQDGLVRVLTAAEARVAESAAALEAERQAQPALLEALERDEAKATAERTHVARSVPADLRGRYDSFRERGRWAVARIREGACEACSRAVQPQMVVDLRHDKVVACHGCHRWLVE